MAATPVDLRVNYYLETYVRPVSDEIASVSRFPSLKPELKKALDKKQKVVSRYRKAIAHLANTYELKDPIDAPLSRAERENRNSG